MPVEALKHKAVSYISGLINLLFPHCCIVCGAPLVRGEEILCTHCNMQLPRTHYDRIKDNLVEKLFWGKVNVERATSYFFYQRGSEIRKIIHLMKYGDKKEIGRIMGRNMAGELLESDFFRGIDLLLPLPLHRKRMKARGYNQSEWIAKGIADVTHLPIETEAVERIKHVETQTNKMPYERWENVQNIYKLQYPERLSGKHVLVIDDVLTTGATAEACIKSFEHLKNIKISVLTLAIAAQ